MANREVFPAGLAPLTGDISAPAGSQKVTVTAIQGIPVQSGTPVAGQWLQYSGSLAEWVVGGNQSILVNGLQVSDDYSVFVNAPGLHNQIKINGV